MHGVVGGTFNILHKGHKALLAHACSVSDFLSVGITTDNMANAGRSTPVRPYSEREHSVRILLEEFGMGKDSHIQPIDNVVGFALDPNLDILVASHGTRAGAEEINRLRNEKGVPPLILHIIGMVLADDGLPISSTRVSDGEVDVQGHIPRSLSIVVGSTNQHKVSGAKAAFHKVFPDIQIQGISASSDVSEQPTSMESTLEGARRRARNAMEKIPGQDYYMGIEQGIFAESMNQGVHICVILDSTEKESWGHSMGYPVPLLLAKAAEQGETMTHASKRIYGIEDIGNMGGITSLLSRENVTRETLVENAVLAALIPRLRGDLYGLEVI